MPTVNLNSDELAAVTAAIRRVIEDDRFPLAPRSAVRGAGKVQGGPRANPASEGSAASQSRQARFAHENRLSRPYTTLH
jgi:hypothetical protein